MHNFTTRAIVSAYTTWRVCRDTRVRRGSRIIFVEFELFTKPGKTRIRGNRTVGGGDRENIIVDFAWHPRTAAAAAAACGDDAGK